MIPEPRDDFNDPAVQRDMAIHEAYAVARQLYETLPPAFAHQFLTDARDDADREFRQRNRSNG